METLARDVRHAIRRFIREPGFTLLAAAALAVGIGSITTVFTIVDSVLLRSLPYKDSARLVVALHGPSANGPVSPADYFDYQRSASSFEGLGAAQYWGLTLGGGERPERLVGLRVSAGLFDLLGVPAAIGRTFAHAEDEPGRNRVVVLGHALWQRRFGGDRSIVGQTISIDGTPHVVIGVMPRTFRFAPFWATRAELWAPLSLADRVDDRAGRSLRLFARLKNGVSAAQAQAEMTAIAARLERTYPDTNKGIAITVRPLLDKVVAGIRSTLVALMVMVTCVLLIACVNVSNTLLARASGRRREIALRTAIGASRGRLVRQWLTESVLLAALGAAAGLALAVWGLPWLLARLPPGSLPRQEDVAIDIRVFAAASFVTLVAGLATGLAPAAQLFRTSATNALTDGSRGTTEGKTSKRVRAVLVAGEVTLALVLLVGAGLMGRTLLKLSAVDPGFRVDHLAIADVSLAGTPHAEPAARLTMFHQLRSHLASMPGVTSVSAINHLPLAGDVWRLGYTIDGRPLPPPGQRLSAVYRIVLPGYFATTGLPILSGRDFTEADTAPSVPVAIVNKAMADRRWPGESPIGRHIHLPGMSDVERAITVVGVAGNARQSDWIGAPDDEVYLALSQRVSEFGLATMTFVVRTGVDAGAVAAAIPREVAVLDRRVPVSDSTTMEKVVADELWRERLTGTLTGLFASVALGLAAIGVYAMVAYSVARRTREFGVRVALGATPAGIRRLAFREGLLPVLVGTAAGLMAAVASSRLMQTLLFEVSAVDPLSLAAAVFVLVIVAVLAAWVPARRASRLDPVAALSE